MAKISVAVFVSLCMVVCFICFAAPVALASGPDAENVEEAIINGCKYEVEVDISEYSLSAEELKTVFHDLLNSGRLPWYTEGAYGYRYDTDTGRVLWFIPNTIYEGQIEMALYERKVAEILDVCVLDGMSEYQIALSIHDYLVTLGRYDGTLSKSTGYDLLVNGTAVCSGYSAAYQDLLIRAGVECLRVSSADMEHEWNLVKIDGNWYHVDVTWDDPTPDILGFVSHDYFLLTDTEIRKGDEPHHGWTVDVRCSDRRFSEAYWRGVNSGICFADGGTCFLLRSKRQTNSVYRRDEASGNEVLLYAEKETALDIGAGSYRYGHQGLSYLDERLLFCSVSSLLSMDADGSDVRVEYIHNVADSKKVIRGFCVCKEGTTLTLSDHDLNLSQKKVSLNALAGHVHSFVVTLVGPTCTEEGYTLSSCSCGFSCQSNFVAPVGHCGALKGTPNSFLSLSGAVKQTCSVCGEKFGGEQVARWLAANAPRGLMILLLLSVVAFASIPAKRK